MKTPSDEALVKAVLDPALVERVFATLEKYPFATLSVLVLAALCLGIAIVLKRKG